jgi:hypothetical protein
MQATDPVTVCLKMSPSSSGRNISFQTLCTSQTKIQIQSADGKSHRQFQKKSESERRRKISRQFQKNQTQSADGKISPADSKIMRRRALTEKSHPHRQFQKKSESERRRKISPAVSKKTDTER